MNIFKTMFWSLAAVSSMLMFCMSSSGNAQNLADSAKMEPQYGRITTLAELLALYPAGSIRTLESAKRAGDDAHKVRSVIDTQFVREQNSCYPKFFATACLAEAKERHRASLAKVKIIDNEANKFKRRAKVEERDRLLAENREKEAADLVNRSKETQGQNADTTVEPRRHPKPASAERKIQDDVSDKRAEEHLAAVEKREEAEAESAKQRASNISAYEKKVQESVARQHLIAAKKLEKERAQKSKSAPELK